MNAFSKFSPIARFVLCGCVVGAIALTIGARQSPAQAKARKGDMRGDPALVKQGGALFQRRGCAGCHRVGDSKGTLEGPDLAGVTDRRTHEWLVSWLKDPTSMFGSDPIADAMYKQFHNVKMPNMHLGTNEIEAIITYLGDHH